MHNPWISFAGAVTGALVAVLLWMIKENRERRILRERSLQLFAYFCRSLAKALPHSVSQMTHVDFAILNPYIPSLMSLREIEIPLFEVQDRYYKWRSGAYGGLGVNSPELQAVRETLEAHGRAASGLVGSRSASVWGR